MSLPYTYPQKYDGELFTALDDDPFMAERIFHYLKGNHWTQLNLKSKVKKTDRHIVYLTNPIAIQTVGLIKTEWVKWSGRQRLRQTYQVGRLIDMDDIELRIQWQAKLWQAWAWLLVPVFWRTLGRLARRKDWYNRGMYEREVMSPIAPPTAGREICLQAFAFGEHPYPRRLYCGYDAMTDTLYIRS